MSNGRRWLLLRYDVESTDAGAMAGFLARLTEVHRAHDLPVTLFCTGSALEARENAFRAFRVETAADPRFDVGDHSYSHIGIGYERGAPVSKLRADYERSFDAHERILRVRPDAISICGTGGKDGERLTGFDATPKAREEFAMLVELGIRRVNAFLTGVEESREFTDYEALGFPEVVGFPSGFSDTSWLWRADKTGDFLAPLRAEIDRRAAENAPLPLICHDWVAWNHAPDRALSHVVRLAEYARERGYVPYTHREAVRLWREGTKE
jgi:Predicted xylanase/chitin deacetylase